MKLPLSLRGCLNACRLLASWCLGQGIDCSMSDNACSRRLGRLLELAARRIRVSAECALDCHGS
jgi:hypothetical protein